MRITRNEKAISMYSTADLEKIAGKGKKGNKANIELKKRKARLA